MIKQDFNWLYPVSMQGSKSCKECLSLTGLSPVKGKTHSELWFKRETKTDKSSIFDTLFMFMHQSEKKQMGKKEC